MARTDIPITKAPLFGGSVADVKALATAGDATNDHSFKNNGKQSLVVFNDGAGVVTVTVVSVANRSTFNRTGDQVMAVAASEVGIFNFTDPVGFNQADGTVSIDLDIDLSVKLLCVELEK